MTFVFVMGRKMRSVLYLINIAIILMIVTYLIYGPAKKSTTDLKTGEILFKSFTMKDVTSITIKTKDASLTLLKKDKEWVIPQINNYSADFDKIQNNFSVIAKLKMDEIISNDEKKYPKFELDNDNKALIQAFDKNNKEIAYLEIGKNLSYKNTYIKIKERKDVLLVYENLKSLVKTDPNYWIKKQVLDIDESEFKTLTINIYDKSKVSKIKLVKEIPNEDKEKPTDKTKPKKEAKWILTEPIKAKVIEDKVNAIVNTLSNFYVDSYYMPEKSHKENDNQQENNKEDIEKTDEHATLFEYSVDNPTMTVQTETNDGAKYMITVGNKYDNKCIVFLNENKMHKFLVQTNKIDTLKKYYYELINNDICDITYDKLSSINIENDNNKISLNKIKETNKWILNTPFKTECNQSVLSGVGRTFSKFKADEVVSLSEIAELNNYSKYKISVSTYDNDQYEFVLYYNTKLDKSYIQNTKQSTEQDLFYHVPKNIAERFVKSPYDYVANYIFPYNIQDCNKINYSGEINRTIIKTDDNKFTFDKQIEKIDKDELMKSILRIPKIRAEKILAPKKFITDNNIKIDFFNENTLVASIHLYKEENDDQLIYYLTDDKRPQFVFKLSNKDYDLIILTPEKYTVEKEKDNINQHKPNGNKKK